MNYEQLQLFDLPPQIKTIHDPYWDELEATTSDIIDTSLIVTSRENEILDTSCYTALQQKNTVGEQTFLNDSPYESVREHVTSDTLKVAPQHDGKLYDHCTEAVHWVEKYWVERVGNKYWYYRYMWMEGRKLHRHYIGSVKSNKANLKKRVVEDAINDGQLVIEIIQLLRGWKT